VDPRIIPPVRKTSVIPAAVLAAGFLLCLSPVVEGMTAHHSKSADAAKGTGSGRTEPRKKTSTAKAKNQTPKSRKNARHLIRQDGHGVLVVERVNVAAREPYGPFLPPEQYNFPQPPCAELDAVIEAHEHGADEEAPEQDDIAETVLPAPPVSALTLVARSIGSFLRPKSAQSTLRPEDVDLSELLSAGVQIPVEGVDPSRLRDSFLNSRGKHHQHLAIDIGAPRGTPVLAAADGEILQLRREKRGGISLYQKDATGRYLLFYGHLSKYAKGLQPGQKVGKGDLIAYVGQTGHVIGGPHLHFSITRLPEDDDNFKAGVAINPYLLFLAAVP
jgi:peptidoglycan LD-endopeptidase LytH